MQISSNWHLNIFKIPKLQSWLLLTHSAVQMVWSLSPDRKENEGDRERVSEVNNIIWTKMCLTKCLHFSWKIEDFNTGMSWQLKQRWQVLITPPPVPFLFPSACSSSTLFQTLYSGSPRWGWIMNVTRHVGQRWSVCEGANSSLIST